MWRGAQGVRIPPQGRSGVRRAARNGSAIACRTSPSTWQARTSCRRRNRVNGTVTYQEPCHLAHAQRITAQPRKLLAQVPGPGAGRNAGVVALLRQRRHLQHHPQADGGRPRRPQGRQHCRQWRRFRRHGDPCARCSSLRRNGVEMPVRHIVEILDEAYGGPKIGTET